MEGELERPEALIRNLKPWMRPAGVNLFLRMDSSNEPRSEDRMAFLFRAFGLGLGLGGLYLDMEGEKAEYLKIRSTGPGE